MNENEVERIARMAYEITEANRDAARHRPAPWGDLHESQREHWRRFVAARLTPATSRNVRPFCVRNVSPDTWAAWRARARYN